MTLDEQIARLKVERAELEQLRLYYDGCIDGRAGAIAELSKANQADQNEKAKLNIEAISLNAKIDVLIEARDKASLGGPRAT